MALSSGDRLGPYEIITAIGAGGMGEVYRARDSRLGRDVAIKTSASHFSERFEREARAVAALNHPNICTLFDVGPDYLVMELIEGPTLADRIAQGPLPLEEALGIASQIADALEAAHEKAIVHRDLKPANIKLTSNGAVKVLDFGLATVVQTASASSDPRSSPTLTMAGVIMGTAGYMSPEQARGRPVDHRADIWAFGVILFEMVTGRMLFEAETVADAMAAVLTSEPPIGLAPASIRGLLERCLDKDPRKRLRDIGDWRLLLSKSPEIAPLTETKRGIAWIPWAITGMLAAALTVALWPRHSVPPPLVRAHEGLELALAVRPFGPSFALSPSGTRIVYSVTAANGQARLYTRRLDQPELSEMPGTEEGMAPFFSPDERWIGYATTDGFYKLPVEGGPPVLMDRREQTRGAVWTRDGNLIIGLARGGLVRVPIAGGQAETLTTVENDAAHHRWPALSPDGEWVLFVANNRGGSYDDGVIWAQSLRSKERKLLHRGGSFPRVQNGKFMFIRTGILYSASVNWRELRIETEPKPILDQVMPVGTNGASQLATSESGTMAYVQSPSGSGKLTLNQVDPDGRISRLSAVEGRYACPSISPDGKRVAVRSGDYGASADLYVLERSRQSLTRVTSDAKPKRCPVWTHDGQFLVYVDQDENAMYVRSDGGGPPQPVAQGTAMSIASVSTDGKWLTGTRVDVGVSGGDIFIVPLAVTDGGVLMGKPEIVTAYKGTSGDPHLSPDGKWLAYTSSESGLAQIYVRPFPNTGARFQISTASGQKPFWAAGGHKLFFETLDLAIMESDCSPAKGAPNCGAARAFTTSRLAPGGNQPMYDVASDGRSIIGIMQPEQASQARGSRVSFLFNFKF